MLLLQWAKPLRLPTAIVIILLSAIPLVAMLRMDAGSRALLTTWNVPTFQSLRKATVVLEPPYFVEHGKTADFWGRAFLPDRTLFSFTCYPNGGWNFHPDPMCVYSVPAQHDPNIGRYLTFYYFDVPSRSYPNHVIMAATGAGSYSDTVLLGYSDSVERLQAYRQAMSRPSLTTIICGLMPLLLLPGLIQRMASGREVSVKTQIS